MEAMTMKPARWDGRFHRVPSINSYDQAVAEEVVREAQAVGRNPRGDHASPVGGTLFAIFASLEND